MYIEAHGKIYTFYDHAIERMEIRKIQFEWVEIALHEPDDVVDLTPTRKAYDKQIDDQNAIRVVVDVTENQIVTVYPSEDE
jgi:Domain of unknown function (DUF4258)